MTTRNKLVAGVALLGTLLVAGMLLPVNAWLLGFLGWVAQAGPLGAVLYSGVYIVASMLMLPASVLTVGAGFLYGPLWGLALVSPTSVAAATLAFLLGRYALRDQAEAMVTRFPTFQALDAAFARRGLLLVILLRLAPVFPFNVLNYGLGLTRVPLSHYVLGSFIGMLPGTALYVWMGSSLASLASLLDGSADAGATGIALTVGGLIAAVAVVV